MTDDHTRPASLAEAWTVARDAFAQGRTVRQIVHITGLSEAQLNARVRAERWSGPPPPDWRAIREAWESGLSASAVARRHAVCADTVRKRARRQNWQRTQASGLAALRRAVGALEQALAQCDAADPLSTARLAAALSMAAGRLSRAEKQRLALVPQSAEPGSDPGAEDEAMRALAITMLSRMGGLDEEDDENNDAGAP